MKVLNKEQENFIKIFAQVKYSDKFYLTGGTALSEYYLQHRLSDDMDLFTSVDGMINKFSDNFMKEFEKEKYKIKLLRSHSTFKEFVIEKKLPLRIHLAQDSPFRFEPPIKTQENIFVDSLIDLATNKLLTIFGRYEIRDYVDIFFIVKEKKYDMPTLVQKSKEKDPGLDEYYLSLSFNKIRELIEKKYLERVILLKKIEPEELENFFLENAVKLLNKRK